MSSVLAAFRSIQPSLNIDREYYKRKIYSRLGRAKRDISVQLALAQLSDQYHTLRNQETSKVKGEEWEQKGALTEIQADGIIHTKFDPKSTYTLPEQLLRVDSSLVRVVVGLIFEHVFEHLSFVFLSHNSLLSFQRERPGFSLSLSLIVLVRSISVCQMAGSCCCLVARIKTTKNGAP